MAFEYLNVYTDILIENYKRAKKQEYFDALWLFYIYILSKPKFQWQRFYCKRKMLEVEPVLTEKIFELTDKRRRRRKKGPADGDIENTGS
jgi:hypothetical protein